MSWELVERLRQRFPEIEPFPRVGGAGTASASEVHSTAAAPAAPTPAEGSPAGPPAPPTRLPPKREEAKAPVFLTPGAWVPRERLLEICRFAATDPAFGMDYLSFVTGVDFPEQGQMEVVYHLFSMAPRHELLLKVRVPRDDPRVPTVTPIWGGANWHEREAYDLLGIIFEAHPNLRRIMMTEDWAGHPLRKDYVFEDPPWLVELATQRQREIEGLGLGERA
jgi:NADH-quinone oxidoreductase subunit C